MCKEVTSYFFTPDDILPLTLIEGTSKLLNVFQVKQVLMKIWWC